jgi:hypothetical protein
MVLALPLAVLTLGQGCPDGTFPGTAGSIAVVFYNDARFPVEPTVDEERMDLVMPGKATRPILFDCRAGEHFAFSGNMRTNTQTLPSPFEVTFDEGVNFDCGDTIEITFFTNADDDLDLDGDSF